jgi:hypothetical protein
MVKAKLNLEEAEKADMGSRKNSTLSLTSTLDEAGWPKSRPGHFTPGKDPTPTV